MSYQGIRATSIKWPSCSVNLTSKSKPNKKSTYDLIYIKFYETQNNLLCQKALHFGNRGMENGEILEGEGL